jgi:hypothetical protein
MLEVPTGKLKYADEVVGIVVPRWGNTYLLTEPYQLPQEVKDIRL